MGKKSTTYYLLIFFSIFVIAGVILIFSYGVSLQSLATSFMWMLACIMTGGGLGFLFSIPKIVQGSGKATDPNADDVGYRLHVNSNLTEISDWLTKIIVGLGLVNLVKIPPYYHSIALTLSNGIQATDKSSTLAFAYGLITCYTILGFLFGYLFTRLFLSEAISVADQNAIKLLKAKSMERESNELNSEVLLQKLSGSMARVAATAAAKNDLVTKADAYMNINVSDYAERVRQKNIKANEMAVFALENGITKNDVADLIRAKYNEGLVIALTTLINLDPEKSDVELLLEFGPGVARLHVQYRVLLAIVALKGKKMVTKAQRKKLIKLVNSYSAKADRPLSDRIESTLVLLNN